MSLFYSTPMTLISRSVIGVDADGNDKFGEIRTDVLGTFAPGSSAEVVQGRDTVTTTPSIYLPSGTVVAAIDAVVIGGVRYEVDGVPPVWDSPYSGTSFGIEVKLREVTG